MLDLFTSGPVMWFMFGFMVGWGLLQRPAWIEPQLEWLKTKLSSLLSALNTQKPTEPVVPVANNAPTANT